MSDECSGHEMPVSPQHQELMKNVGTWDVDCTYYTMDPPMKCKAQDVIEPLGPYWTVGSFTCEIPGMPMPFRGLCQSGFDLGKNKYVATWIDIFSPGMTLLEGDFNEAGVLVMTGDSVDPATQQPCRVRSEHSENEDGTKLFKMWFGENLAMEYVYHLAK